MASIKQSYIDHARGESRGSAWNALLPLGWLGDRYARLRNLGYDRGWIHSQRPAVPVVSVGNLTVGGTSKTPTVEFLVRALGESSVGVLTRGHTGRGAQVLFRGGEHDRTEVGDEPVMLSRRIPESWIAVDPNRIRGSYALREAGCELAIADDAFQHRRMRRAFDLVLVDAICPFGNGSVLPAGILREPLSGIRRADAVLLTRSNQVAPDRIALIEDRLAAHVDRAAIFRAGIVIENWAEPVLDPNVQGPDSSRGFGWKRDGHGSVADSQARRGVVATAIGNPESFLRLLSANGVEILQQQIFPDHHRITEEEVEAIERGCDEHGAETIFLTEKDLFNLPSGWRPRHRVVVPRIGIEIERRDPLLERVRSRLSGAFTRAT